VRAVTSADEVLPLMNPLASSLVTPRHRQGKAIIYIRQSTPHQVLSNQESLRLQYALRQRALGLGWHPDDVEVIDADLGLTATAAQHRPGFQELVAKLTMGQVGLILSFDVTRLARNCSDWYPLLDLCGYRGCLIADGDGVYDPASTNGRLLLGLKGQLSELELHTLRTRLTAGLLNKAARGELALQLPVGLVREADGTVVKDPHQEVQARLALVFATFRRGRSASKVLQYLNAQRLPLPRRDRFGDVVWRPPTVASVLAILKNPAYAGAFVYGRTRCTRRSDAPGPPGKSRQQRLPLAEWKIRVNEVYPAYISWAEFERIQAMLRDNYAEYDRNKTRGVPRAGAALLHGVVYCGECGHKLLVQYKGGTRYLCNALRQQYRVPVCQYLPADPIDAWVVGSFFEALAPVELDAYSRAVAAEQELAAREADAQQQQLERLRYQAALAERQFTRMDPDNRLVAAELERRWEAALRALKTAEDAATREPPAAAATLGALPTELREAFTDIGRHLPRLWRDGLLAQPQKKALLRCLIDKVVVHRVARDQVRTRIVWQGGATTTQDVPVPVGALADLTRAAEFERLVLDLTADGLSDEAIAEHLTQQGHRSPLRQVVLPSTVRTVRLRHRQLRERHQSHPRRVAGQLTVSQLARALDVSPHWLYDRIYKGTIQVTKDPVTRLYLFPDTPATLEHLHALKANDAANRHS
jgi:DNA invertase Pin-like site-specific DNA recombinase